MRCCALLAALLIATPLCAQPNGVLLVAKPGLPDPNFSETVVLVTRGEEGSTVGVILNRPQARTLNDIAPQFRGAENFTQPVHAGGPVMREVIVALFRAETPPAEAAFHVLPQAYLSMHPAVIERLLASPPPQMRLYAGFSGWAPSQLEAEIAEGGWYVLPASEAIAFRRDTRELWSELVARAGGARAATDHNVLVARRATTTLAAP